MNTKVTLRGESFWYTVTDFDCEDFDDTNIGEEVDVLHVYFKDGFKVHLFAELTDLQDGVPELSYPTFTTHPNNVRISDNKRSVVLDLLKKHSLSYLILEFLFL